MLKEKEAVWGTALWGLQPAPHIVVLYWRPLAYTQGNSQCPRSILLERLRAGLSCSQQFCSGTASLWGDEGWAILCDFPQEGPYIDLICMFLPCPQAFGVYLECHIWMPWECLKAAINVNRTIGLDYSVPGDFIQLSWIGHEYITVW